MELLVFGIDGGDLEIMKAFDMPFFHGLLEKNTSIDLDEDLFNRGWVEILTGKEGKDTRGFYMAPKLDGSHMFSSSFKMKDLEENPDVKPLWNVLEDLDIPYCIMNVPTTTPVPKVKNGIVIGSAGGGLNKVYGIPKILVSDDKTRKYLEVNNYIVDIRIPNSDMESTEVLFEKLIEMEYVRTKCFIDICKNNNSEFGFLVDRATTIVQYLARNEIEKYATGSGTIEKWMYEALEKHYAELDENIKNLVTKLNPKNIIITADHNTVPHVYRASVAPFLRENNWLIKDKKFSLLKHVKSLVRKFGLSTYASRVKNSLSTLSAINLTGYDMKNSIAFGSNYIAGIYINDEARFSGPITNEMINKTVDEICAKFNLLSEEHRVSMIAVPYRSKKINSLYNKYLPDIIFERSEGVHFDDDGEKLIWKNDNYELNVPKQLINVKHAAFSGDKGKKPLLIISENLKEFEDTDKNNLTLVYKIVDRYFLNLIGNQ